MYQIQTRKRSLVIRPAQPATLILLKVQCKVQCTVQCTMLCTVQCTVQYSLQCRIYCQVQFTGGMEGCVPLGSGRSASHFDVWVHFIIQYSVQNSVQYSVQYNCIVQFLVQYRYVGCPDSHWVVTSQPRKIKLALAYPKLQYQNISILSKLDLHCENLMLQISKFAKEGVIKSINM